MNAPAVLRLLSASTFCAGTRMATLRSALVCTAAVLLCFAPVSAQVEELDSDFKDLIKDELWLVEFYAPWCEYCLTFEPIWYEVGAELKSLGSPVNVGKIDGSVHKSVVSEFGIHGYPTIKLFKAGVPFNYNGPRTKDDIVEFVNRVSGPAVRTLPSQQLFQHVMSRNDILFVYIGKASPLKENYMKMASEMIVHISFFAASEDILPKAVVLHEIPSVVVFKDGTFFTYNETQDGELSAWVNRERFLSFIKLDKFTLYSMGDTGKLVAMAVEDDKNPTKEGIQYKAMLEKVATEHKKIYSKDFQFGHMNENGYLNGFIMGELELPHIVVLNLSNDGYYLPNKTLKSTDDLLEFLNGVLNGSNQLLGGNGFIQRLQRFVYDAKTTVTVLSMF
ncbi:protein disulfide-isomerase tmx3a isoform X2 [Denticeps clupeoides]|uniref:protein disulfide-isomerase tmx3a isoform X2 n=1 Tax=Denticeps clupeoides TaxID=299321 RepID=UPI0010A599E2|nr:protein disulfide-isomerase TMX3-like isoform X2 [Denticeps clupeoides]